MPAEFKPGDRVLWIPHLNCSNPDHCYIFEEWAIPNSIALIRSASGNGVFGSVPFHVFVSKLTFADNNQTLYGDEEEACFQ
jgi:hypothetical protein